MKKNDDPVAEYYAKKEAEARQLVQQLKDAKAFNAPEHVIKELQRRLDLAYYVGD